MLLVISPEDDCAWEQDLLLSLLEAGLDYYHLRKPHWEIEKSRSFLNNIPEKYWPKIRIHQHHALLEEYNGLKRHLKSTGVKTEAKGASLSCHSFKEIDQNPGFDYYFLSPIFSSISKRNYSAAFKEEELKMELSKTNRKAKNIIALGGVDVHNLVKCGSLGFKGAAVLGAIWKQKNQKAGGEKYDQLCQELKKTF